MAIERRPADIGIACTLLCFLAALSASAALPVLPQATTATSGMFDATAAASPTYFYITFHGGNHKTSVNNVGRYSLDGTPLGTVLEPPDSTPLHELRSTSLYGSHLLVANAYTDNSYIAVYGDCDARGKRSFIRNLVTTASDKYLDHPYGISKVVDGFVYVTSQDTDSVTRYSVASLLGDKPDEEKAAVAKGPSPFANFGKKQSVRGLAVDTRAHVVYVADEKNDLVHAIEVGSGQALFTIDVPSPVGVHFDATTRKLYIGSNNGDDSAVHEYAVDNKQMTNKFTHNSITHPAGIVSAAGKLYVLAQDSRKLHSFDLETADHHVVIHNLPDSPEQITISPC